jgi:hypothetical protein
MKRHFPLLLCAIWLAVISIGLGSLMVYEHTPGEDSAVPTHWPVQSKIQRASDKPTLILFAHPRCPCTRASIGELSILTAHFQNRVKVQVVFFQPQGTAKDWTQTDLWHSAMAIPGVSVETDENAIEARCFRVTTSGHVLLYDSDGTLIFNGGITPSRGHSGDNDGRSAITQLLDHEMATVSRTPVFGCSLFDPKQECTEKDAVCRP